MQALALADDTTGALEIGALFAKDGVPSLVSIQPSLPDRTEMLPPAFVVDLGTRHLTPEDAYTRTLSCCRGLAAIPIYKKTDSALRGNIGSEFRALLDAFPEFPLVYLPAYPALGRTVTQGRLYVHGRPLSQTDFARDALNPSIVDFIPDLLESNGCRGPILLAPSPSAVPSRLQPGSILIGDAATSQDLEDIAAAVHRIGQPYLAAGPGAFAALWIRSLTLPRAPITLPRPHRLLIVGGSAHPVSREQIRMAAEDLMVLSAPDQWEPSPIAVAQRLAQAVHHSLRGGAGFQPAGSGPDQNDPDQPNSQQHADLKNKPNSVATAAEVPNEPNSRPEPLASPLPPTEPGSLPPNKPNSAPAPPVPADLKNKPNSGPTGAEVPNEPNSRPEAPAWPLPLAEPGSFAPNKPNWAQAPADLKNKPNSEPDSGPGAVGSPILSTEPSSFPPNQNPPNKPNSVPETLATAGLQNKPNSLPFQPESPDKPNPDGAPPDGLVIFGGDTAWHVLRTLGVDIVEPRGELLPGIPVSVIRVGGREVVLVTKAGSFGSPSVLREIQERLDAG